MHYKGKAQGQGLFHWRGGKLVMGWIINAVYTLLAVTKSEYHTCKLIRQTGFMEFSKEADLMIGGVSESWLYNGCGNENLL